jgi:hypothetical protein
MASHYRRCSAGPLFFFELSELAAQEAHTLAAPASPLEKRAGIDTFTRFGYLNTVNALAAGNLCNWDTILLMPYTKVYTKLLLNKTEAAFNKRYEELVRAGN